MRTQRLAELAGVNPQTLRYYERIGLLPQPPRSTAGYRDYPDGSVRLLRFVRRAKELGFQLGEIEDLLTIDRHDGARCIGARELAQHRLVDLERRIADLTRMQDSLRALVSECTVDRHDPAARQCPLLDALDGS